jgi:phosphopantetheine adenylyltransferase
MWHTSVGLIKEIVPLSDPAGPTKTDPNIECLVVSAETLSGGHAVNKIRKDAGLPEMDLFTIELVNDLENERYMKDS